MKKYIITIEYEVLAASADEALKTDIAKMSFNSIAAVRALPPRPTTLAEFEEFLHFAECEDLNDQLKIQIHQNLGWVYCLNQYGLSPEPWDWREMMIIYEKLAETIKQL